MNTTSAEDKSELWKYWLIMLAGAAGTLMALALTNTPGQAILRSGNWNWYLIWFIVQLACLLGSALLLIKHWRLLPRAQRVDAIYAYLALEWLLVAAFFVKIESDKSGMLLVGLAGILLFLGFFAATLALVISYWYLRTARSHAPEEMFP